MNLQIQLQSKFILKSTFLIIFLFFSIFSEQPIESKIVKEQKLKNEVELMDVKSVDDNDSEILELDDAEESPDDTRLILLDKIEAIVAQGDLFQVITLSDIPKRDFDGVKHTLDDVINENLLDILATTYKIDVDDDDVNKYLQRIKLTNDQIINIAKYNGYHDINEFFEQMKKMYRASGALNFKVQSELVFDEDVLLDYCQKNPIVEEAVYFVEIASVPFEKDKNSQLQKLKNINFGDKSIKWSEPVELKQNEITHSNDFILKMKEKEVFAKETKSGFDLFRLVTLKPERTVPLSERRHEIISALKEQKYNEVVERVQNNLRSNALILIPTFEQYPVPVYVNDVFNAKTDSAAI